MKKNIGDVLSREAFNIDSARIDPAIPKPGNGFGFGAPRRVRNLRFNMLPKYCTSMSILVLVFSLGVIPLIADTPRFDNRHIVVVVWDGMRPDFVSEKTTPTLWKLAGEGVTFLKETLEGFPHSPARLVSSSDPTARWHLRWSSGYRRRVSSGKTHSSNSPGGRPLRYRKDAPSRATAPR